MQTRELKVKREPCPIDLECKDLWNNSRVRSASTAQSMAPSSTQEGELSGRLLVKILAFADHHGRYAEASARLIEEHRPDWIVLAGDMVPYRLAKRFENYRDRRAMFDADRAYWQEHGRCYRRAGAVTTYTLGNHEAACLGIGGSVSRMNDGQKQLPPYLERYIAILEGEEIVHKNLLKRVYETERAEQEVQSVGHRPIIIYHAEPPPLDRPHLPNSHSGPRQLSKLLHGTEHTRLVIHGHDHSSFGYSTINQALVVNVSTGYALIHWHRLRWQAKVVKME